MNKRHVYLKNPWQQGSGKPKAAALRYDPEKDGAPRLVAAGQGLVAERILEVARKNQIPIMEEPLLTEALLRMDLEAEIPPELYAVVAEVLAFVYRMHAAGQINKNAPGE